MMQMIASITSPQIEVHSMLISWYCKNTHIAVLCIHTQMLMSVTQKMVGVPTPVIIMKEEGTVVVMQGTLSLRTERTVTVSKLYTCTYRYCMRILLNYAPRFDLYM